MEHDVTRLDPPVKRSTFAARMGTRSGGGKVSDAISLCACSVCALSVHCVCCAMCGADRACAATRRGGQGDGGRQGSRGCLWRGGAGFQGCDRYAVPIAQRVAAVCYAIPGTASRLLP
eukprot:909388-Rhodomonas_salina.2